MRICLAATIACGCGRISFELERAGTDGPVDTVACEFGAFSQPVPFPLATQVPELSSPSEDYDAELSFDGTTLWLASDRAGGTSHDLYVATRSCL